MGFFPIARRASLINVKIAPVTGDEADVPKTSSNSGQKGQVESRNSKEVYIPPATATT